MCSGYNFIGKWLSGYTLFYGDIQICSGQDLSGQELVSFELIVYPDRTVSVSNGFLSITKTVSKS